MKKTIMIFTLMALIIGSFSLVYAVDYDTNLLLDGECESMTGWVDPNVDLWGPDDGEIEPHSGLYYLWPVDGERGTEADEESYIYSDVSLVGYQPGETVSLSGFLANYDQEPHDRATLKLSLLDANGNVLAEDYRMQRDPQWREHRILLKIPTGAVTARVTLIATRFVGSDNDAYFDAINLMVTKEQYHFVTVTGDKQVAGSGETIQCSADNGVTTNPADYVWSTSYSQAATVDANGRVTMLSDEEVGVYAKDITTGLTGVYWINSGKQNSNGNADDGFICNFETAGGTPSVGSQFVAPGGKIVEPTTIPQRGEQQFLYWATLDEDGQHYTEWDFDTVVTDDTELVAQYVDSSAEAFICNFETAGGTPSVGSQLVAPGGKIVRPTTIPQRGEQQFLYWGTLDEDGQHYTEWDFDTAVTNDTELVAQYADVVLDHQVTFLTFGGQPDEMPVQIVAHNGRATVPTIVPTMDDMVFDYWTYLPRPGYPVSETPYDFDQPVTTDLFLAAVYKPAAVYSVRFETNGGTPQTIETQLVAKNDYVERPADPQKSGYVFRGWEAVPRPGDVNPQFVMFDFNQPVTENLVLVARYDSLQPNRLEVRFETSGGTPQPSPEYLEAGQFVSAPAIEPQRAGYIFSGWVTAQGQYDFNEPVVRPMIIYAKYSKDGFSNQKSQRGDIIVDDRDYEKAIISYIEPFFGGYPDNTFKPSKTITRAELATVFARVLELDTTRMGNKSFSDMSGHWAASAVSQVADYGIIKGYPDGTFRPDVAMKRAEIAAIINNYWHVTGFSPDASSAPIVDIKGHWAERLIASLYNHRFTDLYIDKTFKPDAPLQRADVAQIMNRITDRPLLINSPQQFSDVMSDYWGYDEVNTAASRIRRD